MATGATRAVAAWVLHLRGIGAPIGDAGADELKPLVSGELDEAVENVCKWLKIDDERIVDAVLEQAEELESLKA